ncbi:tyrosine phosphatase-like protein [Dunaliella salina]|uniref:Very-long-chain (3R)-3-hydroxyacyl-CoA dehydratase n=1 Tax=Dunaliella salina TaxID=3046 RepID=A0ABQ7GMT5_DUNSA|nr:tyrosine phosphatase-like protein [Dunaliella salina]|eukprot:KAF5835920.1 tyrosine phosphatase-like protein [Dunaliella salina]
MLTSKGGFAYNHGNPYLLLYNAASCGGWAYVLYITLLITCMKNGSSQDVYQEVEIPLKLVQTAAVLEVLHSAVGLVRSPVAITAMQVASRLWILWGILAPVPGPTTGGGIVLGEVGGFRLQLGLVTLLVAWGISEVIRYGFFALKELLGYVPYFAMWLRYTGFIVLYPMGVASELTLAYLALPTIKSSGSCSSGMTADLIS